MCAGQFEAMWIHLQCLLMCGLCVDRKNLIIYPTEDMLHIKQKQGMAISYTIVDAHWSWWRRDRNQRKQCKKFSSISNTFYLWISRYATYKMPKLILILSGVFIYKYYVSVKPYKLPRFRGKCQIQRFGTVWRHKSTQIDRCYINMILTCGLSGARTKLENITKLQNSNALIFVKYTK